MGLTFRHHDESSGVQADDYKPATRGDVRRVREHGTDNFQRYRRRAIIGFLLLALGMLAGLLGSYHNDQKLKADRKRSAERFAMVVNENCLQIQDVNRSIVQSLRKSRHDLQTNPPRYYRDHPAELRKALRSLDQEIRRFAPHQCHDPRNGRIVTRDPRS